MCITFGVHDEQTLSHDPMFMKLDRGRSVFEIAKHMSGSAMTLTAKDAVYVRFRNVLSLLRGIFTGSRQASPISWDFVCYSASQENEMQNAQGEASQFELFK